MAESIKENIKLSKERFGDLLQSLPGSIPVDVGRDIVSSFLWESDISNFNSSTKNLAKQYFHNKLDLSPEIEEKFVEKIRDSGNIRHAFKFPNNAVFMADSLASGMKVEQIMDNFDKIVADRATKAFAIKNPEKLGYLMCLEESKLDRTIRMINEPALADIIKNAPNIIAKVDEFVPEGILERLSRFTMEYGGFRESDTKSFVDKLGEKKTAKNDRQY